MLLVVFKKCSSFSDTWETDYLWVLLWGVCVHNQLEILERS